MSSFGVFGLVRAIAHRSVGQLTRVAAALALLALALMVYSILFPRPLPVILAMSVGHMIGAAAVLCYLLAIVLDASRRPPSSESIAPVEAPQPEPDEETSSD